VIILEQRGQFVLVITNDNNEWLGLPM